MKSSADLQVMLKLATNNCISPVLVDVFTELEQSLRKYPTWPSNMVCAAALVSEETGELVKDVNNYTYKHSGVTEDTIYAEAVQVAATAIRFLLSMRKYETCVVQHKQFEGNGTEVSVTTCTPQY